MKKRIILQALAIAAAMVFTGCAARIEAVNDNAEPVAVEEKQETDSSVEEVPAEDIADETTEAVTPETEQSIGLEDGLYLVKFDTDSSMFHVNEMMDGRAVLTVNAGAGNLHLVMPSKNVLNLYSGFATDAENDKNNWIEPSTEEVTYDDGMTEEVFAFDVPVYVLDEEFDLALVGKKNVWYDHKVSISDPQPVQAGMNEEAAQENDTDEESDGTIEISSEGGTGKASITSPAMITKTGDGYLVTIEWSSKHYDYMIVDGVKYEPVEVGETSVYEIPVTNLEEPLECIADTVAMSTPHEIEYTITFDVNSMK